MRIARQVSWTALAVTCASLCLGAARAESVEVYDGVTFPQFKSILSQTKLGLGEQVTKKGNRYLVVTVPGGTAPFIAAVQNCKAGQDAPCEGFAYFYLETSHPMDASAMAQYNYDTPFIKASPSAGGDHSNSIIQGEFYARGGVSSQYVIYAAAYFTAVLESYLQKTNTIATNGRTATPAVTFANPTQPEKFFVELAIKGSQKPALTGANAPVIDEALIDAFVNKRH